MLQGSKTGTGRAVAEDALRLSEEKIINYYFDSPFLLQNKPVVPNYL
jgi:hypothetical protein